MTNHVRGAGMLKYLVAILTITGALCSGLYTADRMAPVVCAHPQSPWYEIRDGVTYACTTTGPVAQAQP